MKGEVQENLHYMKELKAQEFVEEYQCIGINRSISAKHVHNLNCIVLKLTIWMQVLQTNCLH